MIRAALAAEAGPTSPSPEPSPLPTTLSELLRANPQISEHLSRQTPGPNTVLFGVVALGLLALLWFAVKHLAAKSVGDADAAVGDPGRALRLYRRADPWVQALRTWLAAAPVTFVYLATWSATTIIFQGTPETLSSALNRFNSTNIMGLVTEPVRVLVSSAFIVADYGAFFYGYVAVYVLITARLEQRIGSARIIAVGVASHVLASLMIVGLERIGIYLELLKKSTVVTQDVGVSYVMVGTCGAYLLFVSARWRWWFAAGLAGGVVLPLIASHTIWDLGHFLATSIGLLTGLVVRRWGVRPRMTWRAVAAAAQPRPLPTWQSTPTPGADGA